MKEAGKESNVYREEYLMENMQVIGQQTCRLRHL